MQRASVVADLGNGAVVQAALMGMALRPGHFLGMHIRSLALIGGGMALQNHRLMAVLFLLLMAHPLHKEGLALPGACRGAGHGVLRGP